MAIGAITMILANVGLQIYNNWCGSRQNEELQIKRQEFERAAKERNIEHMWKLLREGQELTRQLEEERHKNRLDELKSEIDNLLQKLTYESTISNWPLKVLPLVMKNQAFGNLLANQEENVALHVIFTRSNYDMFNNRVYPLVEKELEQFCDKHWSTISDHPIMFYSGAWKSKSSPTDVQISSMRTALNNLPTLLITPFFRPNDGNLVFQIHMWGVGASSTDKFDIPEIEPTDFQRKFTNQDDYENTKGLLEEIVEDMVPYLQCLIGFMADTYFWSSSGLAPHLPLLVTNGSINTDGMKYLISDSREYYDELLLNSENNAKANPFSQLDLLSLYEGSSGLWDEADQSKLLNRIFITYCESRYGKRYKTVNDAIRDCPITLKDADFISGYLSLSQDQTIIKSICKIPSLKDVYSLSSDGKVVATQSYFIECVDFKDDEFVKYKEECYDILDTINSFINFVHLNKDRIPINDPALYIEEVSYSLFIFHICDPETKKILIFNPGFDYIVECKIIKHQKQIKSIFKYNKHASIICRFSRIDKLVNSIKNNNLIY